MVTRKSTPITGTPVRCAIYTRQSVSSDDGLSSCQVQCDLCRSFVQSQSLLGWTVADERFDDEGESGATLDRPALQRLLVLVRQHGVDQIVVHRLDRLARSVVGYVRLVDELRRHNVSLAIVTAPELGCSAQDHLIFNILAAFAEFEREMIGARIADARSRLKAKGRRIGGAVPYGYDADPRTKQLTVNADEAEVVKWMFGAAAAGMRPTAIAESANRRGWRTKIMVALQTAKQRGGNLWTARQVVATLSNQVYIGRLNDGAAGLHEALVKPELFEAAGEQLRSRRTRPPGRKYEIQWALKGIVVCAVCGRGMSPHTVRHRNIIYRYYRCRSTAGGRPADIRSRCSCSNPLCKGPYGDAA